MDNFLLSYFSDLGSTEKVSKVTSYPATSCYLGPRPTELFGFSLNVTIFVIKDRMFQQKIMLDDNVKGHTRKIRA